MSASLRHSRERPQTHATVVQVRGRIAEDLAEYAARKIDAVLAHTRRPVLHSRARFVRHNDPAMRNAVIATASIDLGGRPLHVRIAAATPREAADRLADRLARRLARAAEHWQARRGRTYRDTPTAAT